MNSQNHQSQGAIPSWDFMQYLDPASRAFGQGVDQQDAAPNQFPYGGGAFGGGAFGGGGPFGGGPRGHHPPGGLPAPAGPHPWGPGLAWGGPWPNSFADPFHRGGGRGPRRPRGEDEPSERRAAARDGQQPHEPPAADDEKADDSDRTVNALDPIPDPAEVTPGEGEPDTDTSSRSPCGPGRRGGRRGCGRPRRAGAGGPWSGLPAILHGMMSHPLIHGLHEQAQRCGADPNTRAATAADATSFTPPVDVYNTKTSYVVHVALPGARKEDLGVAWDPDTAHLRIAGVVHRPGDEKFIATLASAERRVGLFERHVALPPAAAAAAAAQHDDDGGHADPVDADNISARMENGILVVVVPKLEREWTQIRRVDIE